MEEFSKRSLFLALFAATAGTGSIWQVPAAEAEEPEEWCHTYENWVSEVGNDRTVASASCPTQGTCDTPSVRDSWIPGPATPIVTIRLKFNIFCDDDGSNCTSDAQGVTAQMAQLNYDFAPYRIQFIEQTEYINSTFYRAFPSFGDVYGMKTTYKDDPFHQINVYVVSNLDGGFGTFPWDPNALGSLGGIVLGDVWFGVGHKVLTHEVGHNLGLWHTHHGVYEVDLCSACYERADGVDGVDLVLKDAITIRNGKYKLYTYEQKVEEAFDLIAG